MSVTGAMRERRAPEAPPGDRPRGAGATAAPLTIDELAARTGVASRTIRFYQTKGVLAGPERRGRIAVYTAEHAERLSLIEALQARGLRLSAIRDLVRRGDAETLSVSRWLGLDERLATPWSEDAPRLLTERELRELAGSPRLSSAALAAAGLVEPRGRGLQRRYLVPSPGLLRVALELERAGIALHAVVAAGHILRRSLHRAADDLQEFFAARIGRGFAGRGTPEEIAGAVDAMRELSIEAVRLIFAQEIERALRRVLPEERPRAPRRGTARRRILAR